MAPTIVVVTETIEEPAGEAQHRTAGLMLANLIDHFKTVLENASAKLIHPFVAGLATFAGLALGSVIGGFGIVGAIATTTMPAGS